VVVEVFHVLTEILPLVALNVMMVLLEQNAHQMNVPEVLTVTEIATLELLALHLNHFKEMTTLQPNLILNQNTNQSINQNILKNKLPVWCI
jgi:hypothetical protein